jgi:hypothetical protein
LVGRG